MTADLGALGVAFTTAGIYAAQVKGARAEWKKAQRDHAELFVDARDLLRSMYPGGLGACMYCERSEASHIDHWKSMSWYPSHLFDWLNYIYACSVCNEKKGSKLRLHDANGAEIRYSRPRGAVPIPAPIGSPLLINPRDEDPMRLLALDLDTGTLLVSSPKGSLGYLRASHTLTKLGLNKRQLPDERKAMFACSYRASLREYVTAKRSGAQAMPPDLGRLSHRMIWREMLRQQTHPTLRDLFAAAPEAALWK